MRAPTVTALVLFSALVLCGSVPVRKSRRDVSVGIINPNFTDITKYPFTVAINHYKSTGNLLLGGGALVTTKCVLTAAYNIDGFTTSDLRVRVGSNSPTSGGKTYKVSKILTHPSYIANWTYDLSLLKLTFAVKSQYGTPIQIIPSIPFDSVGTAIVTGYGSESTSSLYKGSSSSLELAIIDIFDYKTCNKQWYGTELSEGEICGYTPGVGPCRADYGDPLSQCDTTTGSCTLVGMFSGSYGCADDHFPGIYMDIGYFYTWITENIN